MTETSKKFIEEYINNIDESDYWTVLSELYLAGQETYDDVLNCFKEANIDILTDTSDLRKLLIVNATVANIKLLWASSDENKRVNLTTLKDMLNCTLSLTNEDLKDCFQQAGRQMRLI